MTSPQRRRKTTLEKAIDKQNKQWKEWAKRVAERSRKIF